MKGLRLFPLPIAALALGTALIPGSVAAQSRAEGSFTRNLTVNGDPRVEISAGSGAIEVRTGSSGRIEIVGRIRASDGWGGWFKRGSGSPEERVKQIEANPPIEQSGNVIRIGYFMGNEHPNGVSIAYRVMLPAASTLIARTGSGSQDIDGLSGSVESHAGSGSLTFRNTRGTLQASTGSGSITADSVGGSFRASASSGSIRAGAVAGPINASTSSGSIDVTQTAAGDVEAESSSGSVRLRGIQGGLRASTSSGGLSIHGQPTGEWRLSASSGSVDISLPPNQGFDLDANSGSGRIDVDFPVTVSGTIGRRSVRGAAQGGGPLLHVRTGSGGISIAKGNVTAGR